jgi:hypothetical protein
VGSLCYAAVDPTVVRTCCALHEVNYDNEKGRKRNKIKSHREKVQSDL